MFTTQPLVHIKGNILLADGRMEHALQHLISFHFHGHMH